MLHTSILFASADVCELSSCINSVVQLLAGCQANFTGPLIQYSSGGSASTMTPPQLISATFLNLHSSSGSSSNIVSLARDLADALEVKSVVEYVCGFHSVKIQNKYQVECCVMIVTCSYLCAPFSL